MKLNRKTIIAATASFAVLLGVAGVAFFAFFDAGRRTETLLSTGKIDVELIESFKGDNGDEEQGTDPDGEGLENATKVITGKNNGTQPAYVRVKIFPQVENFSDDNGWNVFGGIPTNYVKYNISNSGWVDGGDGYFYYTKKLPVGETTTPITINNLHLEMPDIVANEYANQKIRVNMLVRLEASQASNELYKLNWNIDKLPSGVEQ